METPIKTNTPAPGLFKIFLIMLGCAGIYVAIAFLFSNSNSHNTKDDVEDRRVSIIMNSVIKSEMSTIMRHEYRYKFLDQKDVTYQAPQQPEALKDININIPYQYPYAEDVIHSTQNGFLYGTSFNGGKNNFGTLFLYNQKTGRRKVLFDFNNYTGSHPDSYIHLINDSVIYGHTLVNEYDKNASNVGYLPNNSSWQGTYFNYNILRNTILIRYVAPVRDSVGKAYDNKPLTFHLLIYKDTLFSVK